MSKNTRNRILLTAVAALLLVAVAVGGTVAYLQATSLEVTNTFVPTDLSIDLNEHDYDPEKNELNDSVVKKNEDYKVVPGVEIPKDPYVTFSSDVSCYVFITVAEANWPMDGDTRLMDYDLEAAWLPVPGYDDVYYQEFVDDTAITTDFPITNRELGVILNDKVTVSTAIDLADMAAMETSKPTLTFDAYIIQKAGFDSVADAWEAANDSSNPTT